MFDRSRVKIQLRIAAKKHIKALLLSLALTLFTLHEEADFLNHAPSCDDAAHGKGLRDQVTEIRNRKIHT